MSNDHKSIYKEHEITITLMFDTERGWTYAFRVDQGPTMHSTHTFGSKREAFDAALQSSEDRIDNLVGRNVDDLLQVT